MICAAYEFLAGIDGVNDAGNDDDANADNDDVGSRMTTSAPLTGPLSGLGGSIPSGTAMDVDDEFQDAMSWRGDIWVIISGEGIIH